jgi:hypothetical protein
MVPRSSKRLQERGCIDGQTLLVLTIQSHSPLQSEEGTTDNIFKSLPGSQGQNLAVTVLCVPRSLGVESLMKAQNLYMVNRKLDIRLPKKKIKIPWREAGRPSHLDDTVDLDQCRLSIQKSLSSGGVLSRIKAHKLKVAHYLVAHNPQVEYLKDVT